jgi:hypothetical protein
MSWERPLNWTETLLQGSAFWVGYKSQLHHYPLTEGAIIGEAAALLNGKLDSDYSLECELMYRDLNVPIESQIRADLIIKQGDRIDSVIEVKRAKTANKKVTDDFKRLAECHKKNPNTRCFLLLVSQKFRPSNYVSEDGKAIRKEIKGIGYVAKVRRACKAVASFKSKDNAHYSCLIEVKHYE